MPYIGHGVTNAGTFYILDDLTMSSSTTYTMQVGGVNVTPKADNLLITLDGVVQHTPDAYTVSGSTITFDSAPGSGVDFYGIIMGQSATIGQGSIGADELKVSGDGTNLQVLVSDGDGTFSWLSQSALTPSANLVTGATLKSTVTASSLTSVGTLTGLTVQGSNYTTASIQAGSTTHGAILNLGDSGDIDYGSITQFASNAGEGGRMRFIAGTTEVLNLYSNGNATFAGNLTVNGTGSDVITGDYLYLDAHNNTAAKNLVFRQLDDTWLGQIEFHPTAKGWITTRVNQPLAFGVNNYEKVTIGTDGNTTFVGDVFMGGSGASFGDLGIENAGDSRIDLFSNVGSGTRGKAEIFFSTDSSSDHVSCASIVMEQPPNDEAARKGQIAFKVSDGGAPAQAMLIENNLNTTFVGNLTVNKSTPYVQFGNGGNTTSASVRIGGDNAAGGRLYLQYAGDSSYIDAWGGHGGTERLRDLKIMGRKLEFHTGDTPVKKIEIQNGGDMVTRRIFPQSHNTYSLGASGDFKWTTLFATNGTINTSDETLKENIIDCDEGAEFIKSLRPVSFNWKDIERNGTLDKEQKHYGFIAQEIIKTPLKDSVTGEEGSYGMNYMNFIAPIVKALQEALKRIETLESA